MTEEKLSDSPGIKFQLSKWFLDFTGPNGEAMIFYSAQLTWHRWSASYTSWLNYDLPSGVKLKSRFTGVQVPQLTDGRIRLSDPRFGVSGTWESRAPMIQSRIFDSEDGFLDWKCYQPSSKVQLRIHDRLLEGNGYAEQLILTVPPWQIPMSELRWGRFISDEYYLVWIEFKKSKTLQWLWLNGERIGNCIVQDDQIILPEKMVLLLDRGVILESEKKIQSVVGKVIRYIPGFNKVMPLGFLMADESKWLSRSQLQKDDKTLSSGMSIHELVIF